MNKPEIGVFGSAFDPPTLGHFDVLQQCAHRFDRILLVPSASHAFSKRSLPFSTRLEMLEVFAGTVKVDCPLEICDLEAFLLASNPEKPVYTYDLLVALEKKYQGEAELAFICGPDNARPEIWNRFYRADDIKARWPVVIARERLNIRSSKVRALINETGLVDNSVETLNEMLLPSITAFIQKHNLYQS